MIITLNTEQDEDVINADEMMAEQSSSWERDQQQRNAVYSSDPLAVDWSNDGPSATTSKATFHEEEEEDESGLRRQSSTGDDGDSGGGVAAAASTASIIKCIAFYPYTVRNG